MMQLAVADIPQIVKGNAIFKLGPVSPDDDPDSGAFTHLTALFLEVALFMA